MRRVAGTGHHRVAEGQKSEQSAAPGLRRRACWPTAMDVVHLLRIITAVQWASSCMHAEIMISWEFLMISTSPWNVRVDSGRERRLACTPPASQIVLVEECEAVTLRRLPPLQIPCQMIQMATWRSASSDWPDP